MTMFEDIFDKLLASFSEWIKIGDPKSTWTIEDFPYETGVDEKITNPHCWKCVTVNQCWFKDEDGKKPQEFDYSQYSLIAIPMSKRGLYHPIAIVRKIKFLLHKKKKSNSLFIKGKLTG